MQYGWLVLQNTPLFSMNTHYHALNKYVFGIVLNVTETQIAFLWRTAREGKQLRMLISTIKQCTHNYPENIKTPAFNNLAIN